jgi:hypothetical protein
MAAFIEISNQLATIGDTLIDARLAFDTEDQVNTSLEHAEGVDHGDDKSV